MIYFSGLKYPLTVTYDRSTDNSIMWSSQHLNDDSNCSSRSGLLVTASTKIN